MLRQVFPKLILPKASRLYQRPGSTLPRRESEVHFARVDRSRYEEVLDLLHNSLHQDEVIRRSLRVFGNVPRVKCIDEYYSRLMDDNLTVMALDTKTNEVRGVSISYLYTKEEPEYKTLYRKAVLRDFPKMLHYFNIMDELWKKASLEPAFTELIRRGPVLNGNFGGVAPGLRGKGILFGILEEMALMAKQEGFKAIIGDPTGRYCRKSMENAGYHLLTEVPYAEYEDQQGAKIFKDIMDPSEKSLALLGLVL